MSQRKLIASWLLACSTGCIAAGEIGAPYERLREEVAAGRGARAVPELRAVCARQEGFAREVTNGYQAGFFWWKLLGEAYRAEKPDEFGPWAYRALVNASAFMPPYTALVQRTVEERLPAAQLYQQLGHACNNIGRLADAERYFYAALALGSNDWDVWQDCAGMLAMIALDNGEQARAEQLLADLFASTNAPSVYAYSSYARVLQYRGKIREMYQVLIEYLETQEMDLAHAKDNPVLFMAVDNLAQATDEEVLAVYEGLGRQLEVAPLVAGCEEGVARLINQRVLLRKAFPWLPASDDVKKVLRRARE